MRASRKGLWGALGLVACAACAAKVPAFDASRCSDAHFAAPVSTYSFSAHGLLATLHEDGIVRLWQLAERRLVAEHKLAGSPVRVAWLDGEDELVVDAAGALARLRVANWTTEPVLPDTFRMLETQRGIEVVRWLADGRAEIISALGKHELVLPAGISGSDRRRLAFAPDGSGVALSEGASVRVWGERGGAPTFEIGPPRLAGTASEVVLGAAAARLAVVGYASSRDRFDGMSIDVFDLAERADRAAFHWTAAEKHGGLPTGVVMSFDGRRIAILADSGLEVHDTATRRVAWSLPAGSGDKGMGTLQRVVFGADALVAESDGTLFAFTAEDGALLGALRRCATP